MATPHVAGAAALLAQRRPDWQAQQLKAALMASAQPLPELGAFEQGAGRVDVARAVTQTVTAQPASVSFGLARWPHGDDDPVTKTVTYHNAGEEAVTLDLSVELTGPDGAPAPASAIRLGATTVTVPAGGTADVEVTSDTRHDGPDGEYTGVLVATAGDQVVSTPLAVVREIESYDLTVSFLGRDGQPATDAGGFLYRIDEPVWIDVVPEGTKPVSRRLPKGQYLLHADIAGGSEAHPTATTLVQPVLTLDRDRTVVADARKAKPISTTVERSSVRPVLVDVGYDLFTDEGWLTAGFLAAGFDGVYLGHLGPEVPEATGTLVSHLHSEWAVPGPAQDFAGSPYLYSLLDFAHQRYFTGFERAVRDRDLAKLISRFAEQLPGRAASRTMIPYTNPRIGMWVAELATDPPQTVTSFLDARDVSWAQQFAEYVLDEEGWPETQTYLSGPATSYRAGRSYADQWNAAVFGPAFAEEESYATRLGDEIVVNVMMYSDAAGHWGGSLVDEARTTLFRDGKKVAESEYAGYLEPLIAPATKGSYRLEVSASRPSYSRLSTRVDTAWTFTSAHVEGEDAVALPLSVVRFAPKVDQHNVGTEGRVALVPVAVEPQPGSPAGRTQRLHVEVSMDDGSTWRPAVTVPAGLGRWLVVVETPANAEYVSLRATATDTKGNTVEQTVVRAYAAGS
jgi:hypothetical protein